MTDQQQRNAEIAATVEHALNQKDVDCREWERQSKQWEKRWQDVTAERDGLRQAQRALCDVLSADEGTIAGQTLVEALRGTIAARDAAERRLNEAHATLALVSEHGPAHPITMTMDILRERYGQYFDGVDVDAFMREIRGNDTEEHALRSAALSSRYAALLAAVEGVVAVGYTENTVMVGRAAFERLKGVV